MTTEEKLRHAAEQLCNAMKEHLPKDVGFVLVLALGKGDGPHILGSNMSPPPKICRLLREAHVQIVQSRSRVLTLEDN